MKDINELKSKLENVRPVEWDDFPDINLYKDQVVAYLKRQLIGLDEDGQLTPAMISNYVKDKLLPKAQGKKYNRNHLALLTKICLLKQVLTVKDINLLLNEDNKKKSVEESYASFVESLDQCLLESARKLESSLAEEDIVDLAFRFAIESYSAKLVCENLIAIIGEK